MALAPSVHNPAGNEGQAPTSMTPSAAGQAAAHAGDHPSTDSGNSGGNVINNTYINQLPPLLPPGHYEGILGLAGLPQDVIDGINDIFAKSYDVQSATILALAYVRGTTWYAQTYPGINAGIKSGLIADERGYRGYVNDLNQVYNQYLQRHVTGDEVAGYLTEGASANLVGRRFAGDLIAKTNAPDYRYLSGAFDETGALSGDEMQAYGREQAGIDTPLGQAIARRIDLAKQRMSSIFQGNLATPSLKLGSGGLTAPSLTAQGNADTGF